MWVELVLQILATALSIWDSKEKTKYTDQLISLRAAYYAEWNKPIEERSDAILDNLKFEIKNLAVAFNMAAEKPKNA